MCSKALGTLAVLSLAIGAACSAPPAEQVSTSIRIFSGPRDATFFILAEAIAALIRQKLPDVHAIAVESRGTGSNIEALQDGSADCALASADNVYLAYFEGTQRVPTPYTRLRGVAVLFPNVLHIVSGPRSSVRYMSQLPGRHIGPAIPGERVPSRRDGRATALIDTAVELSRRPSAKTTTTEVGLDEAVTKLETGQIDVALLYGGYPFLPVTQFSNRNAVTFLEFDEPATSLLKSKYPFFKPTVIPAGTYRGQPKDVHTVAVDNLLICRADLAADAVYRVTRVLHEGLQTVATAHASGQQINTEDGPATPVPLHEGAKRFYRERELFR